MMTRAATLLGIAVAAMVPAVAAAQTPSAIPPAQPMGRVLKSTVKVLDRRLPEGGAKPAGDSSRSRVLGRGYQQGWIAAGAELKLEQQFLAGQPATVTVTTGNAAPLALTVAEPGEQPICRAAPRGCRWQPLFTQRYAITLRNAGGVRVRYYLVVE